MLVLLGPAFCMSLMQGLYQAYRRPTGYAVTQAKPEVSC
jgi:hypothetical protein